MLFSQRRGLKPFEKAIQTDSLDDELRYGLWSCFHVCYLKQHDGMYGSLSGSNLEGLFIQYWHNFFKFPIDNLNTRDIDVPAKFVRKWFLKAEWHEVYDFLEFTIANSPEWFADDFREMVNDVLQREIADTSGLSGVQAHLKQALQHLSDRKRPDYRNSIKEAISAVEAVSQHVTGDGKATLGKALGVLEGKQQLHPALKQAFSKLYGYTSDADGIRHSMLEESSLSYSDGKFMLVACSAFINYVLARCAEDGIEIPK
jgi:hypothetical protein